MSYCYAVASGKGGVGKSTITANLAAALAQDGNRVVIIDADIGLRSQDALLGMENRIVYDLIDLANGDCSMDQAVLESDTIHGLFLLPAAQFARAKEKKKKKLAKIIQSFRTTYDYVLIDCPAGIERGLRNVLNAAVDELILIVTPDDISVRSAERAVQRCGVRSDGICRRSSHRCRGHSLGLEGTFRPVEGLTLRGIVARPANRHKGLVEVCFPGAEAAERCREAAARTAGAA